MKVDQPDADRSDLDPRKPAKSKAGRFFVVDYFLIKRLLHDCVLTTAIAARFKLVIDGMKSPTAIGTTRPGNITAVCEDRRVRKARGLPDNQMGISASPELGLPRVQGGAGGSL